MGLLDVLNGMQNGPRGPSDPNAKSSGMSPITMALLALLAYKAVKQPARCKSGDTPPSPNTVNAGLPGRADRVVVLAICSRVDWVDCSQAVPREAFSATGL